MIALRPGGTEGQGRRFLRFVAVGIVNTAFGYGVYAALVLLGLPPQPALALAFAVGVVWNYATHARFVFGTEGYRRLVPYAAVYLGLYLLNAVALARATAGIRSAFANSRAVCWMARCSLRRWNRARRERGSIRSWPARNGS